MPDVISTKPERILLSAAEVADVLGISVRHFYSLESSGRVGPLPIRLGRTVRWSADQVRRWAEQNCPGRETWLKFSQNRLQASASRI